MFILVHVACHEVHLDILQYLVDHNADLTIQTNLYILSNIFFISVLSNTIIVSTRPSLFKHFETL